MKAISLWQPWASAVAVGAKHYETRSWATDYRGPLAIHAAIRWSGDIKRVITSDEWWDGALFPLTRAYSRSHPRNALPFGVVVCTCNLVDCQPAESVPMCELDALQRRIISVPWTERQMGDFAPGRFAWKLENVRRLDSPVAFKGRQRFFDVPDILLQPQPELASDEKEIIRHSLGLNYKRAPYRNHYCTAKGDPLLEAMVSRGLMTAGAIINEATDQFYHVTEAGAAAG